MSKANELMTRAEVAEYLRVTKMTIHRWSKSKRLNPIGIGRKVLYRRDEVEKCLTPLNDSK